MRLDFQMTETMSGTHHFVNPALGDAKDRPIEFRITWKNSVPRFFGLLLGRAQRSNVEGKIVVDGLTDGDVFCEGTMLLDYWSSHRIEYDLTFDAKGQRYRLLAEKTDIHLTSPLQLVKTHTTCYGRILEAGGVVVSRSVLHFHPDDLLPYMASLRFSTSRLETARL